MSMLATAIKARLPLIAVHTDDPLNVGKLLSHTTADAVLPARTIRPTDKVVLVPPKSVSYLIAAPDLSAQFHVNATYEYAVEREATLIVVNPEESHPAMFDAGRVVMPDSVIIEFVEEYAPEGADLAELAAALRGLSFKDMVDTAKLAMAEWGEFTAQAVLQIRRQRTVLASGLRMVNPREFFYSPHSGLKHWLEVDGRLFHADVPEILRPRGLLFYGIPGTGKTCGAKYLARSLGVPLYLLDVGSAMQKYVGESEKTFQSALAQVDALAPCVLLMDEIEKVFATQDDSGVSQRVLGLLLWWLQEHRSRVVTVMTTNEEPGNLPGELVRPGRIDQHIRFDACDLGEARSFVNALRKGLTNVYPMSDSEVSTVVTSLYSREIRATYAELTQAILRHVKTKVAANLKE